MKFIWHITKKDLRRLAGPLAGLVLVDLMKVCIGLALRSGNGADLDWFNRMALYLNLARGAEVLVIFVLVALLVHEDALVGALVFWRTRPISSGMLLRSKLLTGGLIFGVLPIAIALPWWAICGYGLANMGTAALEMLGWTFCVVVPASALAVLADNLGRYISLTVVGYALGTFSLLMSIAYLPGQDPVTWGMLQSRSMISLTLILVGWVVIIAWQFRRRSVGLPYGIMISLVIVVPLVMWGWSSDIFAAWRPGVKDSSELTRGITLTPSRAQIDYFEGSAKTLDVPLRAEGVPPGRVLASAAADLSWRAHSGLLHAAGAYGYNGRNSTVTRAMLDLAKVAPDEETVRWQEEKRLELRKKYPQPQDAAEPRLSPEEASKFLPMRFQLQGTGMFEPPTMKTGPEMRTDMVFARPQKLMELPLQPSAWMKIDGRSLRITQVRSVKHPAAGNGLAAAFIDKNVYFVSTQPEGEWIAPHWHLFHVGAPMVLAPECWLVSRELGIAYDCGPIAPYFPSVRIDGVQLVWRWATVAEPRVIRNGIWTGYLPDWDKKFTMIVFSYPQEGQFRRTFKLEQIKDNRKQPEEPAEPTLGD